VLLAVLVIVGSAILIATSVAFLASGDAAGGENDRRRLAARSAAWSAVQAAAASLAQQRQQMLEGATPRLDAEFTLWESGGETATARLLPVAANGDRLVAENAKIHLRSATSASLVATGVVDEATAERVLARRGAWGGDGARVPSIDALLDAASASFDGPSAEEIYGALADLDRRLRAATTEDDRAARDLRLEAAAGVGAAASPPLRDLLTTFGVEPQIRRDGGQRLDIGGEWTDDVRARIETELGAGAGAAIEKALEPLANETDPGAVLRAAFAAWATASPDPRTWHAFLDGVSVGEGMLEGRIDIQRAPAAVLRSIPGISAEAAERIVRERDVVPLESRRSAAWLVEQGILDRAAFEACMDRVTTRSLLWRIRVTVAIEVDDGRRSFEELDDADAASGDDAAFAGGEIFEAVIDCTGSVPRIAALRDLSAFSTIVQFLEATSARRAADRSSEERFEPRAELDAPTFEPDSDEPMEEFTDVQQPEDEVESAPSATDRRPESSSRERVDRAEGRRGVGRWRRVE
jgi:hypothetical protein